MSAWADTTATPSNAEDAALRAFAQAVAGDLTLFADLHDREPTAAVVDALHACPLADQLGVVMASDAALAALAAFALALTEIPSPVTRHALDELAAAYADVYLRHTYRAAPTESVWVTEDGLERQAPMFLVREFYRQHNLVATDWANRPDDHIVIQLRFLAHLLRDAADAAALQPVTQFLDAHLLRWVKRHALRLVQADAPDFYAALSLVTACYIDEIRDHLTAITGVQRPSAPPEPSARDKAAAEAAMPYIPGAAPSW